MAPKSLSGSKKISGPLDILEIWSPEFLVFIIIKAHSICCTYYTGAGLLDPIRVHVCACMSACVRVPVAVHMCRPEANLECCYSGYYLLFLRQGFFLTGLGLAD